MLTLNKKEYLLNPKGNGFFKIIHHEVYFNLKIYNIDELEKEAGLMSDFAEAFLEEGMQAMYQVYSEATEDIDFLKDNLLNFKPNGNMIVAYTNTFQDINADVLLSPNFIQFDTSFFKKIKRWAFPFSLN